MMKRFAPWIVLAAVVVYLGTTALGMSRRSADGFNLGAFSRLPVAVNGRVQPIDSVARIGLLNIRGTATVPLDGTQAREARATELDAVEWLLEVLAKPGTADTRPIFPITDRQLLARLSLKAGAGSGYYAFRDFAPKVEQIGKEMQRILKVKAVNRAPWEREFVKLQGRLVIYERLKNSLLPNSLLQKEAKGNPIAFDFARDLGRYRVDLAEAVRLAALHKNGGSEKLDAATEMRIRLFAAMFQGVAAIGLVAVVPPTHSAPTANQWSTTGGAIVNSARGVGLPMSVTYYAAITAAFARGDASTFNDRVGRYRQWLSSNSYTRAVDRGDNEAFYNVFQPFIRALTVYAAALVLLIAGWLTGSSPLYRTGVLLALLAVAVHTTGLLFAMNLAGRPSPITFAGWAVALVALVVEVFWRQRVAITAAAATGLGVLVYSYALTPGGAVTLRQTILDGRLLMAAAVAAALGLAALVRRSAPGKVIAGSSRLRLGYLTSRRSLRTQ